MKDPTIKYDNDGYPDMPAKKSTDLVERLRAFAVSFNKDECFEAADEIERLTEVEAVCIARWRGQEEEIERLKAEKAQAELRFGNETAALTLENRRLKELLDQSHQQGFSDGCLAEREACALVAERELSAGVGAEVAAAIRERKDD